MALIEIDGLPNLKMGGFSMAMLNNQMVDGFRNARFSDQSIYTHRKMLTCPTIYGVNARLSLCHDLHLHDAMPQYHCVQYLYRSR